MPAARHAGPLLLATALAFFPACTRTDPQEAGGSAPQATGGPAADAADSGADTADEGRETVAEPAAGAGARESRKAGSDEPEGGPAGTDEPQAARPGTDVPPPTVPEGALYTWYDARGVPHLAERVEDIPEQARAHVVVARPGGGPEAALADERIVADYTQGRPTFSKVDLSRIGRETGLDGTALLRHRKVYVYSTAWCGYCKKAKAYLRSLGVPFQERDIEANRRAAAEMKAKAEAAGVRVRGVPVLDVHGTLIPGFDRAALDAALAEAGYEVKDADGR